MNKDYDQFRILHRSCWACGATRRPAWWHATWLPNERAHIVNKPRVEDVRAVVCLCSTCHRMQTNSTFEELRNVPALTVANLLFLKIANDPWNYDIEFLNRHSVRKMPMPERLPEWYEKRIRAKMIEF